MAPRNTSSSASNPIKKKKFSEQGKIWEACRRKRFNDELENLKDEIPNCKSPKISKIDILKEAVRYIKGFGNSENVKDLLQNAKSDVVELKGQISQLKKKNLLLTLVIREAGIAVEIDKKTREISFTLPVMCHEDCTAFLKRRKAFFDLSTLDVSEKDFEVSENNRTGIGYNKLVSDRETQTDFSQPVCSNNYHGNSEAFTHLDNIESDYCPMDESQNFESNNSLSHWIVPQKYFNNSEAHEQDDTYAVFNNDNLGKENKNQLILEEGERNNIITLKVFSDNQKIVHTETSQDPIASTLQKNVLHDPGGPRNAATNSAPLLQLVKIPPLQDTLPESSTAKNVFIIPSSKSSVESSQQLTKLSKKLIFIPPSIHHKNISNIADGNLNILTSSLSNTPIMSTLPQLQKVKPIQMNSSSSLILLPCQNPPSNTIKKLKPIAPKPLVNKNVPDIAVPVSGSDKKRCTSISSSIIPQKRTKITQTKECTSKAVSNTECNYVGAPLSTDDDVDLQTMTASTFTNLVASPGIMDDEPLGNIMDLPCVISEGIGNGSLGENVGEDNLAEMLRSIDGDDRSCTYIPSSFSSVTSESTVKPYKNNKVSIESVNTTLSLKKPIPDAKSDSIPSSSCGNLSTSCNNIYSINSLCVSSKKEQLSGTSTHSSLSTSYVPVERNLQVSTALSNTATKEVFTTSPFKLSTSSEPLFSITNKTENCKPTKSVKKLSPSINSEQTSELLDKSPGINCLSDSCKVSVNVEASKLNPIKEATLSLGKVKHTDSDSRVPNNNTLTSEVLNSSVVVDQSNVKKICNISEEGKIVKSDNLITTSIINKPLPSSPVTTHIEKLSNFNASSEVMKGSTCINFSTTLTNICKSVISSSTASNNITQTTTSNTTVVPSSLPVISPKMYLPPHFPHIGLSPLPLPAIPATSHSSVYSSSFPLTYPEILTNSNKSSKGDSNVRDDQPFTFIPPLSSSSSAPVTSTLSYPLTIPVCSSVSIAGPTPLSVSGLPLPTPLISSTSSLDILSSSTSTSISSQSSSSSYSHGKGRLHNISSSHATPITTVSLPYSTAGLLPLSFTETTKETTRTSTSQSTSCSLTNSVFSLAPISSYTPFPFLPLSDAPTTFSFSLTHTSNTSSCTYTNVHSHTNTISSSSSHINLSTMENKNKKENCHKSKESFNAGAYSLNSCTEGSSSFKNTSPVTTCPLKLTSSPKKPSVFLKNSKTPTIDVNHKSSTSNVSSFIDSMVPQNINSPNIVDNISNSCELDLLTDCVSVSKFPTTTASNISSSNISKNMISKSELVDCFNQRSSELSTSTNETRITEFRVPLLPLSSYLEHNSKSKLSSSTATYNMALDPTLSNSTNVKTKESSEILPALPAQHFIPQKEFNMTKVDNTKQNQGREFATCAEKSASQNYSSNKDSDITAVSHSTSDKGISTNTCGKIIKSKVGEANPLNTNKKQNLSGESLNNSSFESNSSYINRNKTLPQTFCLPESAGPISYKGKFSEVSATESILDKNKNQSTKIEAQTKLRNTINENSAEKINRSESTKNYLPANSTSASKVSSKDRASEVTTTEKCKSAVSVTENIPKDSSVAKGSDPILNAVKNIFNEDQRICRNIGKTNLSTVNKNINKCNLSQFEFANTSSSGNSIIFPSDKCSKQDANKVLSLSDDSSKKLCFIPVEEQSTQSTALPTVIRRDNFMVSLDKTEGNNSINMPNVNQVNANSSGTAQFLPHGQQDIRGIEMSSCSMPPVPSSTAFIPSNSSDQSKTYCQEVQLPQSCQQPLQHSQKLTATSMPLSSMLPDTSSLGDTQTQQVNGSNEVLTVATAPNHPQYFPQSTQVPSHQQFNSLQQSPQQKQLINKRKQMPQQITHLPQHHIQQPQQQQLQQQHHSHQQQHVVQHQIPQSHQQMTQEHNQILTQNTNLQSFNTGIDNSELLGLKSNSNSHLHSAHMDSSCIQGFDYDSCYRKITHSPRGDGRLQYHSGFKQFTQFLGEDLETEHAVLPTPFIEENDAMAVRNIEANADPVRCFSVSHLVSQSNDTRKNSDLNLPKDQISSSVNDEKNRENVKSKVNQKKQDNVKKSSGTNSNSKSPSLSGDSRRRSPGRSVSNQQHNNIFAMWNNGKHSNNLKQGQYYSADALITPQNYGRSLRQPVNQNYHFVAANQMYQSTYTPHQMKNFVQGSSFGYSGHERNSHSSCNADYNIQLPTPQGSASLPYGSNVPYMTTSYNYQNLPSTSAPIISNDIVPPHHPSAYSRLHDINSEQTNFASNAAFPIPLDPQDICGSSPFVPAPPVPPVRVQTDSPSSLYYKSSKCNLPVMGTNNGHGNSKRVTRFGDVGTSNANLSSGPIYEDVFVHPGFLGAPTRHQSSFFLGAENFVPLNTSQYSNTNNVGNSLSNNTSGMGILHQTRANATSSMNSASKIDRQMTASASAPIAPHLSSSLSNFNLTSIIPEIDRKNEDVRSAINSAPSSSMAVSAPVSAGQQSSLINNKVRSLPESDNNASFF